LPEFEYADSFEVRRVRHDGSIKWGGTTVFMSSAVAGGSVGVEALDDVCHQLHLRPMPLGLVHCSIRPTKDVSGSGWVPPTH